jgi:predicted XRE-type DNA-binding protein
MDAKISERRGQERGSISEMQLFYSSMDHRALGNCDGHRDMSLNTNFSANDMASMKLRAELARKVIGRLRARKLTQTKAAEILGVTQPRVSNLVRGRLGLFSLDALVDMADRVGLRTRMVIRPKRSA